MKLHVITTNYPAKGHQVNVFVEQLVNEMVAQGVSIEVIAPQSLTHQILRKEGLLPKLDYRYIGENQYRVWRPYYISFGKHLSCIGRMLGRMRLRGIKKVLKKIGEKPDAVYGHFWHSIISLKDYALINNIPVFVACGEGDDALEEMVNNISKENKDKLVTAVKGVISVSSENKRKCIDFGLKQGDDIIVLPNSVDTSVFNNNPGNSKRAELGIKENDFVIAFVGSFIHRKGSARLAEAINKLNDPEIKVIFIGDKRAGDNGIPNCNGICFMGGLEHHNIPDYLKSADVFCLPTLKEGCCNAIVEAMSCGLPIISSNRPFNQDILDDTNSIKIDPMDIDEIANAIKLLKENKELRNRLAEGALRKASSLRLDVRTAKIIEFIKEKMA